jgi:hypothetical protein
LLSFWAGVIYVDAYISEEGFNKSLKASAKFGDPMFKVVFVGGICRCS